MAMETVLVLAAATGRTLVMPPKQVFYLLGAAHDGDKRDEGAAKKGGAPKNSHDFTDFLQLRGLQRFGACAPRVISMRQFIAEVAAEEAAAAAAAAAAAGAGGRPQKPALRKPLPRELARAARSTAAWERRPGEWGGARLQQFLRGAAGAAPAWPDPSKYYLVVPAGAEAGGAADAAHPWDSASNKARQAYLAQRDRKPAVWGRRSSGGASAAEAAARTVHVRCDTGRGLRLLNHFYAFVFFANPAADALAKRIVRDGVRHADATRCAASAVIAQLRAEAKGGSYSAFHIRRGDFQFELARIPIKTILATTRQFLRPGELLYIATDEKDKSVFQPFTDAGFRVRFLGDFLNKPNGRKRTPLLDELNPNLIGMVEQQVAARGRVFVGTWWSTFSGYIIRLRGYVAPALAKRSWYFLKDYRDEMQRYQEPEGPGWWREWPMAWEKIDDQ